MKKRNINIADYMAVIFFVANIFAGIFNYKNLFLERTYYMYMFAYMAVLFIHMEGARPFLLIIPMLFSSIVLYYVVGGKNIYFSLNFLVDFLKVVYKNFTTLSLALILYCIERASTKLFGANFSTLLAFLGLVAFLLIGFVAYFSKYAKYEDLFLYFFVFIFFSNLNSKADVNPLLFPITILLFIIEMLLSQKFNINLGFSLSLLILFYLILKREKNISRVDYEKYLLFSLFFVFTMVKSFMAYFLKLNFLALYISSLIITFFISVILSESRIKILDYLLIGISGAKKKRG